MKSNRKRPVCPRDNLGLSQRRVPFVLGMGLVCPGHLPAQHVCVYCFFFARFGDVFGRLGDGVGESFLCIILCFCLLSFLLLFLFYLVSLGRRFIRYVLFPHLLFFSFIVQPRADAMY